jgi:hypothetical protein
MIPAHAYDPATVLPVMLLIAAAVVAFWRPVLKCVVIAMTFLIVAIVTYGAVMLWHGIHQLRY